jgi:hypothetical protein
MTDAGLPVICRFKRSQMTGNALAVMPFWSDVVFAAKLQWFAHWIDE